MPLRGIAAVLLILTLATSPAAAQRSSRAGGSRTGDPPAGDLRILLVELQVERQHPEALRTVEEALSEDAAAARNLGLEYLYGHLLLRLGRRQEALEAFAATMGSIPELGPFGRYRLAVEQADQGHPEVAAGLVATLLGSDPPRSLLTPAVRLLERTLSDGGDCRLLAGLEPLRWGAEERRRLALMRAVCALRAGDRARAESGLFRLLEEERGDDVARTAAEKLAASASARRDGRSHLLLGLAFYQHREFHSAIRHLARALVQLPTAADITPREGFECRYALARSHFWLGRYESAAASFEALAENAPDPERRAQVLYQRARSLELLGDRAKAAAAYRTAYEAHPRSRGWADAALISRLRLAWLEGDEAGALEAHQRLLAHRRHGAAARGLLFLASSEIVEGRAARAEPWLAAASRLGKISTQELGYWRGRLEEARGRLEEAASHFARVLGEDPYHPFGDAARRRLRSEAFTPLALGRGLASSVRPRDLYAAWLLLDPSDPLRERVHQALLAGLNAEPGAAPYLELAREPTASWPLWRAKLKRPEETLLTLGLFDEGAAVVLRHFPAAEPALAFTGSLALARSGKTKESLYIAEILAERIPGQIPPHLLTPSYRQLLYPLSYSHPLLRESRRYGVDPYLLAAIIREESRFDPLAFSAASARGLTQFVFPTARRVAERIELGPITPRDLEDPETAIALGAAYLEELLAEFGGRTHQAVAAYNAGEPQAELWRRYCMSDEPEEYLTKVSFRQTRSYLTKVLTSREHYAELYGPE